MRLILLALALLAALSAAPPARAQSPMWAAAQSKERYLLAQMAVSVRGWVRIEGRYEASYGGSEERALTAVRERFPGLSDADARSLAFSVLMVAVRDVEADIRIPNPPVTAMNDMQARRERLQASAMALFPRVSEVASKAVRALR